MKINVCLILNSNAEITSECFHKICQPRCRMLAQRSDIAAGATGTAPLSGRPREAHCRGSYHVLEATIEGEHVRENEGRPWAKASSCEYTFKKTCRKNLYAERLLLLRAGATRAEWYAIKRAPRHTLSAPHRLHYLHVY